MERQTSTKNKANFHVDELSKGRADQARLTEPERFRRADQARLTEPEQFRRADQVLMNITNLLNDMEDSNVEVELASGGVRALV